MKQLIKYKIIGLLPVILAMIIALPSYGKGKDKLTPALSVTVKSGGESCNGASDAKAVATAKDGTSPYTFVWSTGATSSGGTTSTITGLSVGTYTVTVTDATSETATASVTVTQPAVLTTSVADTNITCNGSNNGTATATPAGGTTPYTYSWSLSGGTKAEAKNLSAGTYTVTVTDANGCTVTASATITQPPSLSVSVLSVTDNICNGGDVGAITVSGEGGTPGYTYSWGKKPPLTGSTISGLSAGTYTVTVTDANGCKVSTTVKITQPKALSVTMSSSDVLCAGGNTGSVTAGSVSGGTGAYTYSWAPSGGTSATASNLSAGTYTVTITDANGCTLTASDSVGVLSGISISTSSTGISCYGAFTGSVSATVSGGKTPYSYVWTPVGGTRSSASGLSAATYTVTVTDGNNCTAMASVAVTQPSTPYTVAVALSSTCGNTTSSATATVSGGTSPFTYLWTPSGGTGNTATGLTVGNYTVTVHDANACVTSGTVHVVNVTGPSVSIAPTAVTIYSGQHVILSASASGGVYPYTYSWSPTTNLSCTHCSNPSANPTSSIAYTLTVTDANGCTGSASALVTVTTAPTMQTPTSCDTCIGGLNLIPGKTYLVSVWAKNNVTSPSDTDYTEPSLKVEFGSTVFGPFMPQGEIIDGWQRIEGQFTVPLTASIFNIVLACKGGACNFDDIRVFPFNGTLKTYVYDPNTLRLMAVLDERNYATIYEYDEEGKLIRVKKETERGIMTIQESRTSMQKR